VQTTTDELAEAAALAGYAPSIHNSQPWRWRVSDTGLDLYAEPRRQLAITDPDARLATLSCGAALHHARVALAAHGWLTQVVRLPDPAQPQHLAHLSLLGRTEVSEEAVEQVRAIPLRHSDRHALTGPPLDDSDLNAILQAVQGEGAWLHLLRPDDVFALAAAVSHAQQTEAADEAWRAELAYWAGGSRPAGTGVPDAVIPSEPTSTTVASRDFGRAGTLPVSAAHDRGARFAILFGDQDLPVDWLRAGEALSAAWLVATEREISLLPLSATVEVLATRLVLHRLLSGLGQPYLVLRLGKADPEDAPPVHTPRLSTDQTIERG
jgi:nitroreductase